MSLDLSQPWFSLPLVVCDFEADGPDPETCMPVEVACARFEDGRLTAKFQSLLNPGRPIHEDSIAVHGITDGMVIGAPRLEDVASEIAKVSAGAVPVAYNAPYDKRVLQRFVTGTDAPLFDPSFSWLDVFVIIAKVDRYAPGQGRHKLSAACERHGVEVEGAHRALADCLSTHALLVKLFLEGKISRAPMSRMLEHTDKMRREQQADLFRYKIAKWSETASVEELLWALNALRDRTEKEAV